MTLRELMVKILECESNLDKPAAIRVVRRDAHGCAQSIRYVRVSRYFGSGEICVEQSALDDAPEERP